MAVVVGGGAAALVAVAVLVAVVACKCVRGSNVTRRSGSRSFRKADSRNILQQPKNISTHNWLHETSPVRLQDATAFGAGRDGRRRSSDKGFGGMPKLPVTHTRGSVRDQKKAADVKGVEFETLRREQV